MFNFKDFSTNSNNIAVDEEQLKNLSGIMIKYANDLDRIKKQASVIWEQCSVYLDDSVIENINQVKEYNEKKYAKAMDELNNYANKMETVANIWKDTEAEIKMSSKKLESLFSDINKTMTDSIKSISNNINKQ